MVALRAMMRTAPVREVEKNSRSGVERPWMPVRSA
jgi:hypothetical protein